LIEGIEDLQQEVIDSNRWSDNIGEAIDNIVLNQAIDDIPLDNWASPIDSIPALPQTSYSESAQTLTPRRFEQDDDNQSIATGYTELSSQAAPPFLTYETFIEPHRLTKLIQQTSPTITIGSNNFAADTFLSDFGENQPFGIDTHSIDTNLLDDLPRNRIYQFRQANDQNLMALNQDQGEGFNRVVPVTQQGTQGNTQDLEQSTSMILDSTSQGVASNKIQQTQQPAKELKKTTQQETHGEAPTMNQQMIVDPIQKALFLNIHRIHFNMFNKAKQETDETEYKRAVNLGRKSRQGLEALGMTKNELDEEVKKWKPENDEPWNPYHWNTYRIAKINRDFLSQPPQQSRKRKASDSTSSKSSRMSKKAKALIKAQELLEGMSDSE
ncbi:hypothetical protein CROQUDRAFT_667015, partial [Cronartium quercuum f. sp. fusiforme G11]